MSSELRICSKGLSAIIMLLLTVAILMPMSASAASETINMCPDENKEMVFNEELEDYYYDFDDFFVVSSNEDVIEVSDINIYEDGISFSVKANNKGKAKVSIKVYSYDEEDYFTLKTYSIIVDHDWDDGTVYEEATCENDGKTRFACRRCSEEKYETINALGHNYDGSETISPADGIQDGIIEGFCNRCGDIKDTVIPAIATCTIPKEQYTYNGKLINPEVTIKDRAGSIIKSSYYTVQYLNNKNPGMATVKIDFNGKYKGSNVIYYKILPSRTRVSGLYSNKNGFTVKWIKKTTQVSGYQIRYSRYSSLSNAKYITVKSYKINSKAINKLKSNQNYYVQVRTYKIVNGKTYYSEWSDKSRVKTVIKKCFAGKKYYSLRTNNDTDGTWITLNQNMTLQQAVTASIHSDSSRYKVSSGGFRVKVYDDDLKCIQNDYYSLKGMTDEETWSAWFYTDNYKLLPPGDYYVKIVNTSNAKLKMSLAVNGYSQTAKKASMKKSCSIRSGRVLKLGKLTEGLPVVKSITFSKKSQVMWYDFDSNGNITACFKRAGTLNVKVKLRNGKSYTTKVVVKPGDPDFTAYLTGYNTRNNYFTVKVHNYGCNSVTIIRSGSKIVDCDYRSYDRYVKSSSSVVVKPGKTKYIRFYFKGRPTWPDYEDFTIYSYIRYEGVKYKWHVWDEDSVFKLGNKWFATYW